jgi:hypothetical protein
VQQFASQEVSADAELVQYRVFLVYFDKQSEEPAEHNGYSSQQSVVKDVPPTVVVLAPAVVS